MKNKTRFPLYFILSIILTTVFILASSPIAFGDWSFEQELTDWTIEQRVDESASTVNQHTSQVVTNRYSRGVKSARIGSSVVGNQSPWQYDDWTDTIAWKNGTFDLRNVAYLWVDLSNIQYQTGSFGWGFGMQIDLVVSDGAHESRYRLWDRHQEPYGEPGEVDNLYYQIVTGADGTQWYRYRASLNDATKWSAGQYADGLTTEYPNIVRWPLSNVNLSSARVGISVNVRSWNNSSLYLWCNALVDNLRMDDNTAPIITIPSSEMAPILEVTDPSGTTFTFHPTITDNRDPAPNLTITPNLTMYPLGSTPVIFTGTDWAGNQSTITVNVVVRDTTPPTIIAPVDITVNTDSGKSYATNVTLGQATASDVSGAVNITNDAPEQYTLGNNIITWKATDGSGNIASAIQIVTVADNEPPTITAPPDKIAEATGLLTPVNIGTAVATDAVGVISITNDAPSPRFPAGITIVTWTAADAAGNKATATQEITVTIIDAKADINPDTLNLKSQSDKNGITAYIELPSGYDVGQIKAGTIKLLVNGVTIDAQLSPTAVGDYDGDNIPDRMVKFDRKIVISALGTTRGDISMTIIGQLSDGRIFSGTDTVKVIDPGNGN